MIDLIRYRSHDGGINRAWVPEEMASYTKAELLERIQRDAASWYKERITADNVDFYLCCDDGEPNGSPGFNQWVKDSGFKQVYSVLVEEMTVGYADRVW